LLLLQESPEALAHLMEGTGVVMLQREVPEHVNEAVAAAAAKAGVPVMLASLPWRCIQHSLSLKVDQAWPCGFCLLCCEHYLCAACCCLV
jgi:hypothetical protein